jgi:hypothetical protein
MIKDVTLEAQQQLQLLAETFGLDPATAYFKVEARMRFPPQFVWFISVADFYDPKEFELRELYGLHFAVQKGGAIFLTEATLDYDTKLLKDNRLFAPTNTQLDKPVWPRGFALLDQKTEYFST